MSWLSTRIGKAKFLISIIALTLLMSNYLMAHAAGDNNLKVKGFLDKSEIFSSLKLLPPPPAPGSAEFVSDENAFFNSRKFVDQQPWKQAVDDADYDKMIVNFSDEVGIDINPTATPILYNLLQSYHQDVRAAAKSAKNFYKRLRPFAYFNLPVCTADHADKLRQEGSYPSGHTTFAWGAALILAEIAPDKAYAIFAKGYSYGQSRVICGAHWQSDVVAGRLLASSLVAVLHANKEFKQALSKAKKEVKAAAKQQKHLQEAQ